MPKCLSHENQSISWRGAKVYVFPKRAEVSNTYIQPTWFCLLKIICFLSTISRRPLLICLHIKHGWWSSILEIVATPFPWANPIGIIEGAPNSTSELRYNYIAFWYKENHIHLILYTIPGISLGLDYKHKAIFMDIQGTMYLNWKHFRTQLMQCFLNLSRDDNI